MCFSHLNKSIFTFFKYVGFSMRSNLSYRDIFLHKYGKSYREEFDEMILRPPELLVDMMEYGPSSRSMDNMKQCSCSDQVWKSIVAVSNAYQSSNQRLCQLKWLEKNPPPQGMHQMSLTPTLFWYDNIHICETAHYRGFIFDPSYKMVARGGELDRKRTESGSLRINMIQVVLMSHVFLSYLPCC